MNGVGIAGEFEPRWDGTTVEGKRRWGISAPAETITGGRRSQHETTEVCRESQQDRTEKQGDRKLTWQW